MGNSIKTWLFYSKLLWIWSFKSWCKSKMYNLLILLSCYSIFYHNLETTWMQHRAFIKIEKLKVDHKCFSEMKTLFKMMEQDIEDKSIQFYNINRLILLPEVNNLNEKYQMIVKIIHQRIQSINKRNWLKANTKRWRKQKIMIKNKPN